MPVPEPPGTGQRAVGWAGPRPAPGGKVIKRRYVWVLGLGALLLVVSAVSMVIAFDRRSALDPATAQAGSPTSGIATPSAGPAASARASATPSAPPKSPTAGPSQSRRPSPPSGAGPNRTNCGGIPSACGYPDATNTGVPAGTKLTVVNGSFSVTKAGTVIDGKDIRGCVDVQAPDVTIRRSKITCTSDVAAIRSFTLRPPGQELLVEDVEIDCVNRFASGLGFNSFILRRVEIRKCDNGADIDNNVTVEDSWIHSMYMGPAGHPDGLQFAGGSNIVIRHNTIFPGANTNAAIITDRDGNSNVLIEANLMAGGSYTFYCPMYSSSNVRVIGNRFSTVFWPKAGEYGPWVYCENVAEARGNVWDSNLRPLS